MKELNIEAKTENLERVLKFIDERLMELGCGRKQQLQIDIAAEELFVNIAHYAYKPVHGRATVRVEVEDNPLTVKITFIDQGIPYDPLAKADPDVTLSAEDRPVGGLGIFLVKKAMDQVRYAHRNGNNILRIEKYF